MQKVPDAPHEVLLVLDGSTGQNACKAKEFTKSHRVTAWAITKLDGTARVAAWLSVFRTNSAFRCATSGRR
jgi:fused signal recognition particle receptor